MIESELHPAFLNWTDRRKIDKDPDSEPLIAEGLRNILARGNSRLRQSAPVALSQTKCLDRFRDGDVGVQNWSGELAKLGDCTFQHLSIGPLQFSAIDYGDSLNLSEKMQRRPLSIDREGATHALFWHSLPE